MSDGKYLVDVNLSQLHYDVMRAVSETLASFGYLSGKQVTLKQFSDKLNDRIKLLIPQEYIDPLDEYLRGYQKCLTAVGKSDLPDKPHAQHCAATDLLKLYRKDKEKSQ